MNFVSRTQWGARNPKSKGTIGRSQGIFVHHTVTGTGGGSVPAEMNILRGVQSYHMDSRGWNDIAYSWLVGQSGTIYEGRGWGVQGGHTENWNSKSHAVCFIGNSDSDVPTQATKAAINTVIAEHNRRYGNGFIRNHGDVAQTACPGRLLRDWVRSGRDVDATVPAPPAVVVPPAPSPVVGRATVRRGSTGPAVKELQSIFNKINDRVNLAEDGIFGAATEAAVRAFQGWTGLVIDGIVGPATWAKLDEALRTEQNKPSKVRLPRTLLRQGARGADVRVLQESLNKLGSRLAVDGIFGPATTQAVRATQQFWRLAVDGIVGEKTWATLEWLVNL